MSDMKIVMVNKNYSSWSLRGWLGVKQTGAEFEEIIFDLWTEEFNDKIKRYSPTGCVPVLVDKDIYVWESIVILDYLDRKFPDCGIWPKVSHLYAHAKAISAEMHAGFMSLRGAAPMNLRENRPYMDMDEKVKKDVARVEEIWTSCLNSDGNTGPFLFGNFSGADMMYAPVVARLNGYGIKLNDTCMAYMKAVLEHPFLREWYEAAAKETFVIPEDEIPATQMVLIAP